MKKIIILVFLIGFIPLGAFAKKRNIEIEIEVLLDGEVSLTGGYINIVNQIPKSMRMPAVENLGIRVLDKDGRASIILKDVNDKGVLNITLLRDKCDWYSDFHEINLNQDKREKFKITLKPKSEECN